MDYLLYFFREENDRFLRLALSEESKRKRRRTNKVSIQMTVLSWFLEFITGLVGVFIRIHSSNPDSDVNFVVPIIILDASINFVIIPSSYLFNNEVNKSIIIAEGWYKMFKGRFISNKVTSSPNNVENIEAPPRPQPSPIRSISGNLRALECRQNDTFNENSHKDIMELTANSLFSKP